MQNPNNALGSKQEVNDFVTQHTLGIQIKKAKLQSPSNISNITPRVVAERFQNQKHIFSVAAKFQAWLDFFKSSFFLETVLILVCRWHKLAAIIVLRCCDGKALLVTIWIY